MQPLQGVPPPRGTLVSLGKSNVTAAIGAAYRISRGAARERTEIT